MTVYVVHSSNPRNPILGVFDNEQAAKSFLADKRGKQKFPYSRKRLEWRESGNVSRAVAVDDKGRWSYWASIYATDLNKPFERVKSTP